MSTANSKHKRKRACIPCHQRKRKCDGEYPCERCTTYQYSCRYTDDDATVTTEGDGVHISPPPKRIALEGRDRLRGRPHTDRDSNSTTYISPGKSTAAKIETSTGIFDERKSRYAGASAAMAFPHVLGVALGSNDPPKMRSFANNFGIRPEETSETHLFLGKLISEEDLELFSGVYFSGLAAISDVLDPRIYTQRCRDYYQGSGSTNAAFAAVAAGVASLGSFLSLNRHPQEPELVQYAKTILDDPNSMRKLNVDHIVAWGMRMMYLRATTRPNNAWIASCTLMHLCETVGLHEEANIKKMASLAGAATLGHDADRLRRIFWIAWAGHNMLSYEQDRSAVQFRAVTCQAIVPTPGSVADQFIKLVQIIPSPNSPFQLEWNPSSPAEELFERLKGLSGHQVTHPFLVVTKAEIAFCFYRRIYQLKTWIPEESIQLVIDSGNAGVEAAQQMANQGRLFWNVIGSVFQYACVLLAMGTSVASVHINTAFQGLENLVKVADTRLTREALSMARHLLSLKMAKKRKELAQLEAVEANFQFDPTQSESIEPNHEPDLNWEFDWDEFFVDPYLSMLGSDV